MGKTPLMETAQRCVAWVAADDECEDRLGDLEEFCERGSAASQSRYLREAGAICLSILRRRIGRGGEDMVRLFLWAAVSVSLIFLFLSLGGADLGVYVQPFEWGIILSTMLGLALAGQRFGVWRGILSDLRLADHLSGEATRGSRADYMNRLKTELEDNSSDFAHIRQVARIAQQTGADADRLMAGSIALFRGRCDQKLKVVAQTATDAYIGSAIALFFGIIFVLTNTEMGPEPTRHLLAGALDAPFFGLIIGRAVLAPMARKIGAFYEQRIQEMEAFRLSIDEREPAEVSLDAFGVLMSTERKDKFSAGAHGSAKSGLFVGVPVLMVIVGLIARQPIIDMVSRLDPRPDPNLGREFFYELPLLRVNLNAPGQLVLHVQPTLQTQGGKAAIMALQNHFPQIIDAVQNALRDKAPDDFRGSAGLAQLRPVLQAQINGMIKPQLVSDVLFKNLWIEEPQPK